MRALSRERQVAPPAIAAHGDCHGRDADVVRAQIARRAKAPCHCTMMFYRFTINYCRTAISELMTDSSHDGVPDELRLRLRRMLHHDQPAAVAARLLRFLA